MINVSKQFVDIIYNLSREELSEETKKQIKRCFIDYLSVVLAGSKVNYSKIKGYVAENKGIYSILGIEDKVDINSATVINAYNSHVLELDDGHRRAMMHLGAPIFSSLMSVAEVKECTMESFLKGAVVGYEAAIRVASAIQPKHKIRGFHATGTCGTIGCALAIAAMLEYNKQEMLNVLSAACTSGAGLLEVITGKSQQKPYNISNAAISGVNAALFGKMFEGPEDVLAGKRGFLNNFCDEVNIEPLICENKELAVHGIYMKPYAACRHCHAPIEAALVCNKENQINIENIEGIVIDTYNLAVFGHDHVEIEGVNSAKMSIPYSVAVAMLKHSAGLDMFTEEVISDKDILNLTEKVKVSEDEALSELLPNKRAAIICVKMKDGNQYTTRVDYPKGEPENPITDGELEDKFVSLTKNVFKSDTKTQEIIEFVREEKCTNIKELIGMINKEGE